MADFAKPIFNGRTFDNPSSFTSWSGLPSFMDILRWKFREPDYSKLPSAEELESTLPVQIAKFNLESQLSATWLGHATVFVRLNGANFITDPVWASRASPFRLFGPRRYRPPSCQISDLPQLNFAVISHNHYDHFDSMAVQLISKQFTDMEWFVPMGVKQWFDKYLDTPNPVTEMTWGDMVTREYNGETFKIWCVPAQHWSQRFAFDRNKTLWCGFAIIGDTGFCNEEFFKIGNSLGPFDLAAIPIGCYLPRWFMKSQHINPKEAVEIHTLSKAKRSLAIHWGTYEMGSNEHYLDPPKRLQKALKEKGLSPREFIILNHGACFSVEDPSISNPEYSDLSDTSS